MTDPTPGFEELEHHFEAASLALGRGDRAGAAASLRAAVADAERHDGAAQPLAYALARLGELAIEDGHADEAEALFQRALGVGEQALGAEHPDLVVLLNALSRLYLRRGAHDLAEPLLQRLYTIKRTKGEDHPEVATVLASLATVRQALGRHDAAEQLWRRVVEIRERTLAPNHVGTAAAIERLADACLARAKPAEAVQLLQRALAMRELTLGAAHPSVRAVRERIADVQLQAADADGDGLDGDMGLGTSVSSSSWRASTPAVALPALPAMPTMPMAAPVTPTSLPVVPAMAAMPAMSAPALLVPEPAAAASAIAHSPASYAPPAAQPAPTPASYLTAYAPSLPVTAERPAAQLDAGASRAPSTVVLPGAGAADGFSLQKLLMEIQEETAEHDGIHQSFGERMAGMVHRHRVPAAIVGAVVLLGAAFAVASAVGSGDAAAEYEVPAAPAATPAVSTPAPSTTSTGAGEIGGAYGVAGAADAAGTSTTRSDAAALAAEARATERATERAAERAAERADATAEKAGKAPSSTAAKSATTTAAPTLASLGNLPTVRVDVGTGDPVASRMAKMTASTALGGDAAAAGSGSATQPARLIGAVPVARYPQSLRQSGVQGEVRVSFEVDTLGRPDMGTLVVLKSEHELFTRAVRGVIPEMRFVPAEVGGKKARWLVRMPFVFSVAK